MSRLRTLALIFALAASTAAVAANIKIGVIGPSSGPFALEGKNFQAGIEAWMSLNGDKVGDDHLKVEYLDYSVVHDSPLNRKFVAAAGKALGDPAELTFPAVGAYDGMFVITKMIGAVGGKPDAAEAVAAVNGLALESPRGPVVLDAQTRTLDETIYLRIVDKVDGRYVNREIERFPDTPDFGLVGLE